MTRIYYDDGIEERFVRCTLGSYPAGKEELDLFAEQAKCALLGWLDMCPACAQYEKAE